MRLAALGVSHETNVFASRPTGYDRFLATGIYRGQEIVRAFRDAQSTMAGFLEAGEQDGVEVVPLIFTQTEPLGTITKDAFDRIVGEMIALLAEQGPWDGVLLALHGAAVSEAYPDMDAEVARRVRATVGPEVPIGLAIDMHANVSQAMIGHVTATVAYRTNPHLDPRARAVECAEIIVKTVRGEVRPVQALETPPLVINIVKQYTGEEPMAGLLRDVEEVLRRPGMLSASVTEGYPWADVAEMGMAFLAVHDGDSRAAHEAARWLARRAWERRDEMIGTIPGPEEAIRYADAAPEGPIVIMDVGDNIYGGGAADSTVLLEIAQQLGVRGYLQTLYDPEAVAACVAAGVGGEVTLEVGAKTDTMHGRPVRVTGWVRALSDGRFEEPTAVHEGFRFFDAGQTAVL